MMWSGWPIPRILLLFTAIAFVLIFVQVTLFHSRQNFRHWAMWGPVLETPLAFLLALALVFYNLSWLRTISGVVFVVGALSGVTGFVLHTQGVGQRVDGYSVQNFLVGPPIMLPLMVTALSLLGLIALFWR